MCNELGRIAFCIWRLIDSHFSPASSFIFCSTTFEQPPRTSMMMLYWLTLYSGYRFVSSSFSWVAMASLVVFSKSLDSLLFNLGQLIYYYYYYDHHHHHHHWTTKKSFLTILILNLYWEEFNKVCFFILKNIIIIVIIIIIIIIIKITSYFFIKIL